MNSEKKSEVMISIIKALNQVTQSILVVTVDDGSSMNEVGGMVLTAYFNSLEDVLMEISRNTNNPSKIIKETEELLEKIREAISSVSGLILVRKDRYNE